MKSDIDNKIIELIKRDESISYSEISRKLGIPEEEVDRRIKHFSDTRQKILIVDDEMDALLPLKRSLVADDYYVFEAYDGHEAIR